MEFQTNIETMQDLNRGSRFNLFTEMDHSIVREAIASLSGNEHKIVLMRFWENNTITEIAGILNLSFQEVEQCLTQALMKLKEICLRKSEFSRSKAKISL